MPSLRLTIGGDDAALSQWRNTHNNTGEVWVRHPSSNAGLDVPVPNRVVVPAGARSFRINLGIRCSPNAHFMLVPRSSMGSKTLLRQSNSIGVIDSSYRGMLALVVDNLGEVEYTIDAGTRLCQIVGFRGQRIRWKIGNVDVDETTRGEGGFGSSGGTL